MITRTILLSLLLAGAGCAHRTYVGATYSGTSYSSGDSGYYYEPATSRGAGARALMNHDNDTEYSDTVSYDTLSAPDSFVDTTQGAGARVLTGRPDTTEFPQAGVATVYRTTAVGGGEIGGGTTVGSNGSLRTEDANFVREAMQLGMTEVRMGELAQQKAQSSSVRQFGQMLVSDHQKSNDELQQLAQQKQISTATSSSLSSREQGTIDKLSSAEGRDFDRAFERDAVKSHEKAIKLFKREADRGQDSDLRAFAQKNLPSLEQHLQEAKELKKDRSST
jgi:putative membrane protein